jgi:hypothetical protein
MFSFLFKGGITLTMIIFDNIDTEISDKFEKELKRENNIDIYP